MSDDLREMLEASVKEAEGKNESVTESAAKLEPEVEKPKEEVVEQPEKVAEVEDPAQEPTDPQPEGAKEPALLAQDKAPAGWTPAVREMWGTLPKEVREEIVRREEASAVGVRKLQAEVEPMRGFVNHLGPIIQEAVQSGANPAQYIFQVMASEKALRNPDENARFEALLAIADNYKIPLREVINASVGREVIAARPQQAPQVDPSIQQELMAQRQWRQQQEEQVLLNQIEEFKKDAEFFEDVRPMMANMITANPQMTLKEAYDAAVWANPSTREVLQKRSSKSTDLARKQAQAAGTSVVPSGEVRVRTKVPEQESTLEDDLREAMNAANGRT